MDSKLDNQINHRIAALSGLLKRQIYRIIAETGIEITPDQWVILSYLWESDGLSIGELVLRSRKDFANVTRIVEKLQTQGYVTKRKSEKDKRSFLVYHSEKALQIKSDVEKCQQRSLAISLTNVSGPEQELLLKVIGTMEENTLCFLNRTN